MPNDAVNEKVARVVHVLSDSLLVLNRGSRDGIRIGGRFLVYSLGVEIFDPDSQESLGQIELVRGVGRVTHIQEKMCTIESEKREPAGKSKKIIDRPGGLSFLHGREIVETIEPSTIVLPFENPTPGDFAKPI